MLALDLTDRAVSVARDGHMLASAPGVVFDGSTAEPPGTPAWQALRRQPTALSTTHLAQLLGGSPSPRARTLTAAQLTGLLSAALPAEPLVIAVPAQATPAGLAALLTLAREHALNLTGFVDAAAAQAAALGLPGATLVIELGLHHIAASLLERTGDHVAPRRVALAQGGWLEVQQAWIELVGRTLIKQTRFDPLHGGESEQQLFDALPALLARAAGEGAASAVIEERQVMISRDQLAQAAAGLRREVLRLAHGLRPAGRPLSLLVPATLLTVPGLAQDLESLSGCELVSLPDGFAATALAGLSLPAHAPGEAVRLLRRLPVAAAPLTCGIHRTALGSQRQGAPPPSHVLLGGEAHPLLPAGPGPLLVVGCDPGELPGTPGLRALRLGTGLAGVSRRHCTFLAVGADIVLADHSRFGTFVNGERVAERVAVHAGDRIRLGDPGLELALIAVGGP